MAVPWAGCVTSNVSVSPSGSLQSGAVSPGVSSGVVRLMPVHTGAPLTGAGVTSKVRVTSGAGFQLPSPAWLAVIEQVPTATRVAAVPETVQTDSLFEANETGRPEGTRRAQGGEGLVEAQVGRAWEVDHLVGLGDGLLEHDFAAGEARRPIEVTRDLLRTEKPPSGPASMSVQRAMLPSVRFKSALN